MLEQDRIAARELAELVAETKSTLTDLVGIAPRAAAEIIVEVGDVQRFSEAGFARFNGTAEAGTDTITTPALHTRPAWA